MGHAARKRGPLHIRAPHKISTPGQQCAPVQWHGECRAGADVPTALAGLRQRGIRHAIVQEHISGQEWKFYAVRGYGVIHAFAPHDPHCPPIDPVCLNTLAQQAGAVLGLDVYGGDCLLTADGDFCLIDINDWPSFRGCRPAAATQIARHILSQAQQRGLL